MKKNQLFIVFVIAGVVFVILWVAVLTLTARTLLGSFSSKEQATVVEIALCDENAGDLCVVNFGTNSVNRMVIYFRLPDETYPAFYVKAKNRDTVSVYTCETDETDLTLVRCTGVRTPLGEAIDLEVYTTDKDGLVARGTFLVTAVAIPTPITLPTQFIEEAPPAEEIFPTPPPTLEGVPLPFPDSTEFPPPVSTLAEIPTFLSTPEPPFTAIP